MKLMPHMEPTRASRTFYQHWCILRLRGDYSTEISSCEGKLEKTVCWERSSTEKKLPVVGEMHEQKPAYGKVLAKVSSEIFFFFKCCFSHTAVGHQNWEQGCWGLLLGDKVVTDFQWKILVTSFRTSKNFKLSHCCY